MWMFYVVVLYCIATGKSYPFKEKDKMVREIRKHVLGKQWSYERTDKMVRESNVGTNTNHVAKEIISDKLNISLLTEESNSLDINVNNTVFNSTYNLTANETKSLNKNVSSETPTTKTSTELDVYDNSKSDNNHKINSYVIHLPHYLQKYLQKENPLKGFLRETIHVQGHRKQRHRRSFYFDFDMFNSDFEDSEETDVIFSAHTSPCNWSDRFYCLNGGTCVFVHALEIKTCR